MKKNVKIAVFVVLAVLLVPCLGGVWVYLPHARKAHITGTEVRRMDAPRGQEEGGAERIDVRYVKTFDLDEQTDMVYQNVDTRWGFPFYFKFDSAELGAHADRIARDEPNATVLVTYYGVRSPAFDIYPNVVDIEVVDRDHVHVPVFNILFFTFGFAIVGVVWLKVHRFRKRRAAKKASAAA